ncbi:MAG: MBL fold metallo-hydrolase [Erysipelotrichaceae bacterium]
MYKLELHGANEMNCYLVCHQNHCFIMDPGYDAPLLQRFVREHHLIVEGILLTHAHFDHIGALHAFDVPIYLHEQELALLHNDVLNGFATFHLHKAFDSTTLQLIPLQDGATIPLLERTITMLHTPGHTAGSVCYVFEEEVYTGDTLFQESVGNWTFPTGNLASLKQSVVSLLDTLPQHYILYPGHGPMTTVQQEKATNPFYQTWSKELHHASQ